MKKIYVCMMFLVYFVILQSHAFAETYDSYIVKYKNSDIIDVIMSEEKDVLLNDGAIRPYEYDNSEREIEYIEPNYEVFLYSDTNKNWNVEAVKAEIAWEYGCYGNGIKIAVLDSGLERNSGIEYNTMLGYNVINGNNDITDRIGHGTFVTGIISNPNNNSYSEGIAKKAEIIPIKCFDVNYTTRVDKIAEAIEYATNVCECDVINMSFGLNGNSAYLKSKIDEALQKGIIIVAAVGNNGTESIRYPAAYDGVIGVGAVDQTYTWCSFSQHNPTVDIVAPGKNIVGVSLDNYMEDSGTSFAAPHVTSAAAIALSIDDTITPSQFMDMLKVTSNDLGSDGYDEYYGYGLLNIEKLSEYLINRFEFFMSPISIKNDIANVTLYNNTSDPISVAYIFSTLNNGLMVELDISNVEIYPFQKLKVDKYIKGKDIKCYLWNSIYDMEPLFMCR